MLSSLFRTFLRQVGGLVLCWSRGVLMAELKSRMLTPEEVEALRRVSINI
jgi:hypothetical protein